MGRKEGTYFLYHSGDIGGFLVGGAGSSGEVGEDFVVGEDGGLGFEDLHGWRSRGKKPVSVVACWGFKTCLCLKFLSWLQGLVARMGIAWVPLFNPLSDCH